MAIVSSAPTPPTFDRSADGRWHLRLTSPPQGKLGLRFTEGELAAGSAAGSVRPLVVTVTPGGVADTAGVRGGLVCGGVNGVLARDRADVPSFNAAIVSQMKQLVDAGVAVDIWFTEPESAAAAAAPAPLLSGATVPRGTLDHGGFRSLASSVPAESPSLIASATPFVPAGFAKAAPAFFSTSASAGVTAFSGSATPSAKSP